MIRFLTLLIIFLTSVTKIPLASAENVQMSAPDTLMLHIPYIEDFMIDKQSSMSFKIHNGYATMKSGESLLSALNSDAEIFKHTSSEIDFLKEMHESGKLESILFLINEDAEGGYETKYSTIQYYTEIVNQLSYEIVKTIENLSSVMETRHNSSYREFSPKNDTRNTMNSYEELEMPTPLDSIINTAYYLREISEIIIEIESFNSKVIDFNTRYNNYRQIFSSISDAIGEKNSKDAPEDIITELRDLYISNDKLLKESESYLDILRKYGMSLADASIVIDDATSIIRRDYRFKDQLSALEHQIKTISDINLTKQLSEKVKDNNFTLEIPDEIIVDGESIPVSAISCPIAYPLLDNSIFTDNSISIILPGSITEITYSFNGLDIDKIIAKPASPPTIFGTPFNTNCWDKTLVYVPDEAIGNYLNSAWTRFFNTSNFLPISTADVAEIESGDMSSTQRIYTIQGIYVGDTIEGLPKGIYIIRNGKSCRKMAVE